MFNKGKLQFFYFRFLFFWKKKKNLKKVQISKKVSRKAFNKREASIIAKTQSS